MRAVPSTVEGGLADPVLGSQAAFRSVMDAMARPGCIERFRDVATPPAPLSPYCATIALSLCDQDTPVWLDGTLGEAREVAGWLAFHCGVPLARNPADAHFALVAQPGTMGALEKFAQGTQDYPDRSATIILQVSTLAGGRPLTLRGPGILDCATIAPDPMPRHFVEQWRQNNERFPRGVDIILAAPDGLICLPRTTRVEHTGG